MRKTWSNKILILPNVTMELSNVRKKIRVQLNTVKVWSYVMLVLSNVNNGTVKYEKKKIKVPQNVRKVQLNMMLVLFNVIMKSSNVRKKIREPPDVRKKKILSTTKCEKGTVKCDVGIT